MTDTQKQRVLRLLRHRRADRRPVNVADFHTPAVDGGAPIMRLASRIDELRDDGHGIETRRAPNGTADYFLRRDADALDARPVRADTSIAAERLFDPAPAPLNAAASDWDGEL